MRWLTRLTSIAVIALVVGGVALLIVLAVPRNTVSGGFRTYTKLRDGSRLAIGSHVVIAGVSVGVIERMTIEGRFARIDMRLQDGLDLTVDSFATKRADSLFGDSYVEIIPGTGDDAESTRKLKSGEPIQHVIEGSSSDAVLRAIDSALPKIDNALDVVHDKVLQGRVWVGGSLSDRLTDADLWLAEGHIENPMERVAQAMVNVDSATERAAEAVHGAVPDVASTLDRWDAAIVRARSGMRDARTGLVQAMRDTREGLDRVDPQIAQATELFTAINEGQGDDWKGTLGRLVNDPELGETLDDVTSAGREAVAGFNRFRSWLGGRVEIDVFSRRVRFYATAELRARTDKFYLVEFERGPLGAVPKDQLSEVAGAGGYTREQQILDKLRFTAQFGKQIGWLSVRGGLKDSTFGAGADALLIGGRLKLSADVFGSFQPTPRLKLASALRIFRSLYVIAGVDDALNEPGYLSIVDGSPTSPKTFDKVRYGRDYFVGTTLQFTDEDISTLLRLYGALLVGLL